MIFSYIHLLLTSHTLPLLKPHLLLRIILSCLVYVLAGKSSVYDDILIDVGTADTFYKQGQLLPEAFAQACAGVRLTRAHLASII